MLAKFFQNFDFWIISCLLAISSLGLLILGSIKPDLVGQQAIFFLLGFFLFFLFSQIDYRVFFHFRWFFYFLALMALFVTLIVAPETRGALRWLEIGSWQFQSSEIIKPFLILTFAGFLSTHPSVGFKKLFFLLALFIPLIFLIFKQPDLGNVIILLLVFGALLVVGGLRWSILLTLLPLVLAAAPLFWHFLKDYQKARILSFLDPQADPLGKSYQLIQAMVTVGSGELFGRGLGRGTQSHLRFLPEQHTDFIFASLSEELGFFGAGILLILYFFLLWRILTLARNSKDPFGVLILSGVFTMILAQVFVNIGMNIGLLPITGITLPLISYGGSSIISIMISLGIVEAIAKERGQSEALEIK